MSLAPARAGSAVVSPTPARSNEFNRLDETDLVEARALSLLRPDLDVSHDASSADFGIAYEKKGGTKAAGCGTEVFPSQRSLQDRCKQLAMARGFQLIVSGSSTRPNGGGNVKYRCKKLHGQQFFDPNTPAAELQCPFYINGYGNGAAWKITRACFLHNHYKFIGWRAPTVAPSLTASVVAPVSLSSDSDSASPPLLLQHSPQSARVPTQRNTTLSTKALCQMVTDEVNKFPAPGLVMAKLDGKLIKRILLGRGHTINHMMASRIKRQLHLARVMAIRASFQALASYFKLVAAKNPGSLIQVETTELGVFTRTVFIPSAALHAFKRSRKLIALDRILPAWCDSSADPAINGGGTSAKGADVVTDDSVCGVYLKALCKDANDDVVTFALALVTEETQANWEWFLTAVQTAAAVDMAEYVVVAGRTGGVAEAIASVWPQTAHRFCMRRFVEDELAVRHRVPGLTLEKAQRVYDVARSESESEFNALRTELARVSDAAVAHLDALPRHHWVKYAFLEAFRKPTFNDVTCDLATTPSTDDTDDDDDLFTPSATHTSWFGADPLRSSQPLATFSRYFLQLAQLFRARREALEQRSPKELVPMRLAQMERILQGSQRCEVRPASHHVYDAPCPCPHRVSLFCPTT